MLAILLMLQFVNSLLPGRYDFDSNLCKFQTQLGIDILVFQ